jgi:hypothetical protein
MLNLYAETLDFAGNLKKVPKKYQKSLAKVWGNEYCVYLCNGITNINQQTLSSMNAQAKDSYGYTLSDYAKPIGKTRYTFELFDEGGERIDTRYHDSYTDAYSEWIAYSRSERSEYIDYVVAFETTIAPHAFEIGVIDPNRDGGKRIKKWRAGEEFSVKNI